MKWIDAPDLSVPYYTFENLEDSGLVVNVFTTRLYRKNGQANDFFQPLLRKESDPSEVADCVQLLLKQFHTDREHLVPSAQKHTTNIHVVTDADLDPVEMRTPLESVDGMITNLPGVMLETFGADCPSVYLLDPLHRAIGLCHSGRKGTQGHIAAVMLYAMTREYGTSPADILAAISPGICRDCYEVGDDVAEDFTKDYLKGIPAFSAGTYADNCSSLAYKGEKFSDQDNDILSMPEILQRKNGRYYIDLPAAIRISLEAAGVPGNQIEASPLCTKCRSDIFYSFRAEGRISNENAALLMLKDEANSLQ